MNMEEIIHNINELETKTEQIEIYAEYIIEQVKRNQHIIQKLKNEIVIKEIEYEK